jgi:hypothetical protein
VAWAALAPGEPLVGAAAEALSERVVPLEQRVDRGGLFSNAKSSFSPEGFWFVLPLNRVAALLKLPSVPQKWYNSSHHGIRRGRLSCRSIAQCSLTRSLRDADDQALQVQACRG